MVKTAIILRTQDAVLNKNVTSIPDAKQYISFSIVTIDMEEQWIIANEYEWSV